MGGCGHGKKGRLALRGPEPEPHGGSDGGVAASEVLAVVGLEPELAVNLAETMMPRCDSEEDAEEEDDDGGEKGEGDDEEEGDDGDDGDDEDEGDGERVPGGL